MRNASLYGEHAGAWCGAREDEPSDDAHALSGRRLEASDCSHSFNEPHEQYDPYAGDGQK